MTYKIPSTTVRFFSQLFYSRSDLLRNLLFFSAPQHRLVFESEFDVRRALLGLLQWLGQMHPRRYGRNAVRIDDEEHVPPRRCEISIAGHCQLQ